MENNGYESEVISDDDSIHRYLRSQKKKDEKENESEWDEDREQWDDYFLDDYNLDISNFLAERESEKTVDSNLEKELSSDLLEDSAVSYSSSREQRLNMVSQLKELHQDQKQLKLKNSFLHKKCRDIFIKLKIMNHLERWGFDSDIHNDRRYIEILKEFEAVKINKQKAEDCYKQELDTFEDSYQLYFSEFREAFQGFTTRELEIGAASVSRETKKITNAPIMNLLNKQEQRLNILSRVRVQCFKLENLLENIRSRLDNRNILGGGYTIIKYENLMMNKNTLVEKIDETVKDLEKIRDKFFTIVHILAHVREVSVGVEGKIEEATEASAELENSRREKRVELSRQRALTKKQMLENNHSHPNLNL